MTFGKVATALLREARADQGIIDLAPWERDAAECLEKAGAVDVVRRGPGGWPEAIQAVSQ